MELQNINTILFEVGKAPLPGLDQLDLYFKDLKESKNHVEAERVKRRIEKQMELIFGPPFEIDLHWIGELSYNCAVIPILKTIGEIEKTEDSIKLGNVRKVYIVLGMLLVDDLTPRQLTAVFLHEIGHIVNHISNTLKTVSSFMGKLHPVLETLNLIPVLNAVILPLYIITSRTLSFSSHMGEYHADKFAVEYGYGDELISVMHKWNKESVKEESELTFSRMLYNIKNFILGTSHPDYKDRIKKMISEIKEAYANKYHMKKLGKILDEYYS